MSAPVNRTPPRRWRRTAILIIGGCLASVVVVVMWNSIPARAPAGTVRDPGRETEANEPALLVEEGISDVVELHQTAWDAAGLQIEPAKVAPFRETVRVTGTITLNEDRVAHLFPLVQGRVDQVLVRFGQNVRAGDVLAIVQSTEVGERKLELVQARLAREVANVDSERADLLNQNTQAFIAALKKQTPLEQLESEFANRPMGGHRRRLVTAYSALIKASADYDRLDELTTKGITSAKDFAAAKAIRDAARATYAALLDEIAFEVRQDALTKKQSLEEVDARVAAAESYLAILGYSKKDLDGIDPTVEGEALAHYPVVAPFDGTILKKDAALLESVGPDRKLFEIADLSTVWVVADLYERHLPLIDALHNRTVLVRSNFFPDEVIEASVFFTGATVDPQTRTARLRAVADNADGRLRPGMFVEVELPAGEAGEVLQIPESSLQNHEGTTFVFVHRGGDRFEKRDVSTGRRSAGFVEVVDGLKSEEPVVVSGGFALKSRMLAELMAGD